MTDHAPGGTLHAQGGALLWRRDADALVAPARVEVDDGAYFCVDIGDPAVVIEWCLPFGPEQDSLDSAFGRGWRDDLPAEPTSATRFDGEHRLEPDWARLATVIGVVQRYPLPLDLATLDIDLALAYAAVGLTSQARLTIGLALTRLLDLADTATDDGLPVAVSAIVIDAVDLARNVLEADHVDRPELDRLHDELALTPPDFDGQLLELLERSSELSLVAGVGAARGGEGPPEVVLDPAVLPPRTLQWRTADKIPYDVAVGDDALTVSVELADGVLATDAEARNLIAYSTFGAGGAWLTAAPLLVGDDGRTLTATLELQGRAPAHCTVGLYSTEHTDSVAASEAGRMRAHARRLLLEAWLRGRQLQVEPALADALPSKPSRVRAGAEQAAVLAARRGRQRLVAAHELDEQVVPVALAQAAHPTAVAAGATAATRPLLVELLAALPLDIDR